MEENFRRAVANSLSSRRRQAVAPSSIKIVDEGVREVNGRLEVAMFAETPDGVISADRLAQAVRQQESQIAAAVSTVANCNYSFPAFTLVILFVVCICRWVPQV